MTEGLAFRNPVRQEGWAQVYHVLTLDQDLSDGAFRLYVLLLRYARRGENCWPGRDRLAQDLGKDTRTIERRLRELVGRGLITREQRLNQTAMTWIEDVEDAYGSVPVKNVEDVPGRDVEDLSPSEVSGKEEAEEETDMVGVLTTEQGQSLSLLTDFGVTEGVARVLARDCDSQDVRGWIEYARRARGLHTPVAFVVSKLKAGEPVPARVDAQEDSGPANRRRYLEWAQ